MIDLDRFRKLIACLPFVEPDAGCEETQQAMQEIARELEAARRKIEEQQAELEALSAMLARTPCLVEHIASNSIVAAFAQPDIARQYIDRGHEIGHWRFQELRLCL